MTEIDITTEDARGAVVLAMEGFWHPNAGADFDRWLASIKAEAWDQGHRCAIGYVAVPEMVPEGGYANPYRVTACRSS